MRITCKVVFSNLTYFFACFSCLQVRHKSLDKILPRATPKLFFSTYTSKVSHIFPLCTRKIFPKKVLKTFAMEFVLITTES